MYRILLLYVLGICLMGLLISILVLYDDEILEIEGHNTYWWQKYMNEEEYNKLEKGMYYIDVVKIAGGAGIKVSESIYEWNDEIHLTKGYQVYFENGKIISTEIVIRKGNSNR